MINADYYLGNINSSVILVSFSIVLWCKYLYILNYYLPVKIVTSIIVRALSSIENIRR